MTDLVHVLHDILTMAETALREEGVPVGIAHLTPGQLTAWDDCCESGGQLWLRTQRVYPTAGFGGGAGSGGSFPAQDSVQAGGCANSTFGAFLGLGVVRCAHTVDDHGNPPSATDMSGDAGVMLQDMRILQEVIGCLVDKVPGVMRVKFDVWAPQGVEGGCAGGEWGFYVAYNPCLCQ